VLRAGAALGVLLCCALLVGDVSGSRARSERPTVRWPGPATEMPPRRERLQNVSLELYRDARTRMARFPHARGGTLSIGGRRYALMLGRCALPESPVAGEPGGYIRVAGGGRAVVTFSEVESQRHIGITLPDGRWFLGAAPARKPAALHGTLDEPNFHYLRYEQKATQLLGPAYEKRLAAMPRAKRLAFEARLARHVARTVPRWTWSVRLTCR
jgi:hypothetical protein